MKAVLGRLARACTRHRVPVLAVTALLMAGLALGIPHLRFEDDPVAAMPTGDPHTLASQNLTRAFPGSAYASPVFVSVDPAKWPAANAKLPNRVPLGTRQDGGPLPLDPFDALGQLQRQGGQSGSLPDPVPGPRNVTDEVYMRGMHEMFRFLQARVPELKWGITLESQVRLVNYTNTGIPGPGLGPTAQPLREPDPAAFTMPGTDPQGSQQFSSAWTTYYVASPASVRSIVSRDWSTTRLAFLFEPGGKTIPQIGADLQAAVDAYRAEVAKCDARQACSLQWNVFERDSILVDPRAPTAAASHLTETTLEDLLFLGPIAVAVVGAFLFLQFRRPGTVAAMVLPLGLSGLGVLGAFGLLGIPIHSVSLLVFPVLIGTGIDFGIHMAASYHGARAQGRKVADAAFESGQGAGVPLVVVTVTTLVGMLFLVLAPNKLLAELGLAITLGLSLLLLVSLTALPAALSWTRSAPPGRTILDRGLASNARFWGRHRVGAVALVVLLAGAGVWAIPKLETLVIGTPAAFFPEGDRQRDDFEASNARYFRADQDLVSNVLVLEGDLTRPEAMDLLRDLEQDVRKLDFVRADSAVSIRFAMNAWIQVRQGSAGAPAVIAQETLQPGSTFPATQADVRAVLDEMFATPLANYISFFIKKDAYDIGVMLVELDQPGELGAVEARWDALNAQVAQTLARHPDAGIRVHVSGASAIAYLFTAKELPYLNLAGLVGLGVTVLLVLALQRSLRDALVVAAVVLAAGAWWAGLLVLSDIPLSIALVVPVVILEAIGSDYALHLRYTVRHEGGAAWAHVGKAVWYAALTDIAAFSIFVFVRYGLLRQATVATVYVLVCALVATLVLVPAFSRRSELPEASA